MVAGGLEGSVALVTGGANGLGRAIVTALADSGAKVGVLDLAPCPLDRPDVLSVVDDVAADGAVDRALAALEERWGPASILVNDAADYPTAGLLEMEPAAWRRVFDVNVTGLFLACRAFVQRYLDAGLTSGRIVSISTGSARSPRPRGAAYASSKAAVETISATLAMELGPLGITSNVVAPGYIDVRGASDAHPDRASDELRASLTASIPTGRAGLPTDIANAVRFLCLPESDHVNAAVLAVDGGSGAGRFRMPGEPRTASSPEPPATSPEPPATSPEPPATFPELVEGRPSTSSGNGVGSPGNGVGSPGNGVGSPEDGVGSPEDGMGSPGDGVGSPGNGVGSPGDVVGAGA